MRETRETSPPRNISLLRYFLVSRSQIAIFRFDIGRIIRQQNMKKIAVWLRRLGIVNGEYFEVKKFRT